jgi:hypothetical protein
MAIIARSAPIGVDIPIAGLQKLLYNSLLPIWITANPKAQPYTSYDRCYAELIDTGYVPKMPVQNSAGVLEYAALSFDPDTNAAVSFAHVNGDIKHDWKSGTSTAQVQWFFAVDLSQIKPNVQDHRADEEARNDVLRVIYSNANFELNGWVIGYKNVFKEFSGQLTEDKKEGLDLQPLHVFRIDTAVAFKLTNCTPYY